MVEEKRRVLLESLINTDITEPISLPYSQEQIKELLFDKKEDHYVLAKSLKPIFSKIDFSNVSFDNVDVSGVDFTGIKGIKLNPQTIYEKRLCNTKCHGVEFIGEGDIFRDVCVAYVNFTGSKGAIINPQTIYCRGMCRCVFTDVTFVGSFDQGCLNEVNFLGSRGAKINFSNLAWNLFDPHLEKSNLTSVEIVGKLKNRKIKALYYKKNKKLSLKSK